MGTFREQEGSSGLEDLGPDKAAIEILPREPIEPNTGIIGNLTVTSSVGEQDGN